MIHESDVLRFVGDQLVDVRYRLPAHVRVNATVRTLEADALVRLVQKALISVKYNRHFAVISWWMTGALVQAKQPIQYALTVS